MSDNVRSYLDARKRYDLAARQASDVINVVQEVAGHLTSSPLAFMFSNTAQAMPEVGLSMRSKSVDANKWPTAAQIQAALVALHQAKSDLSVDWTALPQDDRSGMVPPPDRFVP